MNRSNNAFVELADQAGHGDFAAGVKLRQELEPQLVYIVRYALREEKANNSLHRRIRDEASRLGYSDYTASREEQERVIRKVAHSVCASVIADLLEAAR